MESAERMDRVFAISVGLEEAGYQGTFTKDEHWHPIAELDRESASPRRGEAQVSSDCYGRTFVPGFGYVNNFVFRPAKSVG